MEAHAGSEGLAILSWEIKNCVCTAEVAHRVFPGCLSEYDAFQGPPHQLVVQTHAHPLQCAGVPSQGNTNRHRCLVFGNEGVYLRQ